MISVNNIEVVYPGAHEGHVLDGLSFSAGEAERVALIGANGAGKSTLLLSLVGILPLHDGEININNIKLGKNTLPAIRRAAGLIFQNPDDQLFMSTVWEDILFGPLNYLDGEKLPKAEAAERQKSIEAEAEKTLELLGIAALKNKISHKLSGGEKRLAALASVLVMQPEIILMDEPTAFLDPRARRRLIGIVRDLPQTLIIATHDIDFARELCPRSIVLCNGKIRADGDTQSILADTRLLDECGL